MTRHRPNDTRYPFPAIAAGLTIGAGVAGALFLVGTPLPLVVLAGLVIAMSLAGSIKYVDQWERAVLMLSAVLSRVNGERPRRHLAFSACAPC